MSDSRPPQGLLDSGEDTVEYSRIALYCYCTIKGYSTIVQQNYGYSMPTVKEYNIKSKTAGINNNQEKYIQSKGINSKRGKGTH